MSRESASPCTQYQRRRLRLLLRSRSLSLSLSLSRPPRSRSFSLPFSLFFVSPHRVHGPTDPAGHVRDRAPVWGNERKDERNLEGCNPSPTLSLSFFLSHSLSIYPCKCVKINMKKKNTYRYVKIKRMPHLCNMCM